jgi:tRNA dimethylallyltransferase
MSSVKPPLVVIVGPTAVGKTEISIQLAERMEGEIVSADSRLFYRGMDIGTAKPTPQERSRVAHHLIDVVDPSQTWSLSVFQSAATHVITDIHARGRLPFLVGGTGQYINAVIHGWIPPLVAPDPRLRTVMESLARAHGKDWLHDRLALLDPASAASIDPRNLRRTIRALEVIYATGKRFSDQRGKITIPYQLLMVGLTRPRPELFSRIDLRIESMFAAGLLDEVRGLLDAGYTPDMPSMSAIGYRESILVVQGQMTIEEAKVRMRRSTRVFVRRQANWFKLEDDSIRWFEADSASAGKIEDYLRNTLEGKRV